MTSDNKAGSVWYAARERMNADRWRLVAETLNVEPAKFFALSPFCAYHDGEKWWMAAAVPPMPVIDEEIAIWTPACIDEVVLIDPKTGETKLMSPLGDNHVLLSPSRSSTYPQPEVVTLYTDGIQWGRAWAAARQDWIDTHMAHEAAARSDHEASGAQYPYKPVIPLHEPVDNSMPGILVVGDVDKVVDWVDARQCSILEVDNPRMVRTVSDALLRSARLPKVAPRQLRAVA